MTVRRSRSDHFRAVLNELAPHLFAELNCGPPLELARYHSHSRIVHHNNFGRWRNRFWCNHGGCGDGTRSTEHRCRIHCEGVWVDSFANDFGINRLDVGCEIFKLGLFALQPEFFQDETADGVSHLGAHQLAEVYHFESDQVRRSLPRSENLAVLNVSLDNVSELARGRRNGQGDACHVRLTSTEGHGHASVEEPVIDLSHSEVQRPASVLLVGTAHQESRQPSELNHKIVEQVETIAPKLFQHKQVELVRVAPPLATRRHNIGSRDGSAPPVRGGRRHGVPHVSVQPEGGIEKASLGRLDNHVSRQRPERR